MSRLIDDKNKVGPGSYNVAGNLAIKPKMITNWQASPTYTNRTELQ